MPHTLVALTYYYMDDLGLVFVFDLSKHVSATSTELYIVTKAPKVEWVE
jgi:hypothetical protein